MKIYKDNWFGVKTDHEASQLKKQLNRSYKVSNPKPLCVKGFEDEVVTQAIRLMMLPPSLIIEEFDEMLRKNPMKKIRQVEKSILEIETEKIRNMNDDERKEFSRKLLFKEGYHLHSSGGLTKFRTGCDNSVFGFAIDPITLKFKKSNFFGSHHTVNFDLAREIIKQTDYNFSKYGDPVGRIIVGLIFTEIEYFKTPILKIRRMWEEDKTINFIVNFLKRKKKFIIIDDDYKVL